MADAQGAVDTVAGGAAESRPLQIEANGINVIADAERKGHPRDLFWPWFAANVSVLGLSLRRVRARLRRLVLAGGGRRRGRDRRLVPALRVHRDGRQARLGADHGAEPGRRSASAATSCPALISWLLTVGWETVLMILATLATATVFERLGWGGGTATKVVALIVVAALTIAGGVMGFDLIMRMQTVITVVTGVLTVVYIILVADKIHWHAVSAHAGAGSAQQFIGALVFVMTGFGLGWVNAAADYSRYLPRTVVEPGRDRLDDVRRRGRPDRAAACSVCCWPARRQAEQRDRAPTRSGR